MIETAILSGLVAGAFMAAICELAYRLKIFTSSLVVIDALFIRNFFGKKMRKPAQIAAGSVVHLVTSSAFGGFYGVMAAVLKFNPLSPGLLSAYVGLLWISMLVTALPVAGQGFFGKKLGSGAWFEQLILHVCFGLIFWGTFSALSG